MRAREIGDDVAIGVGVCGIVLYLIGYLGTLYGVGPPVENPLIIEFVLGALVVFGFFLGALSLIWFLARAAVWGVRRMAEFAADRIGDENQ